MYQSDQKHVMFIHGEVNLELSDELKSSSRLELLHETLCLAARTQQLYIDKERPSDKKHNSLT